MNSIETLKLDFNSQIKELNKIHNDKILDDCIFVGIGGFLCGWAYCRVSHLS